MAGALTTPVGGEDDAKALEAAADEIDAAAAEQHAAARAVRQLADERRDGRSWLSIAQRGGLRATLERVGAGVQSLRREASRIRRAAARGMVGEGASTRRIGALFGVSHQRVSSIVAQGEHDKEELPEGTAST